MQLWEWVLREDRRLDLTDPAAALEWFAKHRTYFVPFPVKWDKERPPWPKEVLARWQANVNALRSLAQRLRGRKGRTADIEAFDADDMFARHIYGLRLLLDADHLADGQRVPLTASRFTGVSLSFGSVAVSDYPKLDPLWAMLSSVQDAVWRKVFGSLATDQVPPVCSAPGCGKPLEPTPGGRVARAPMCKACKYKSWYAKQPKTKLRQRWAANKRNERQRNHEGA